MNRQSTRLDRHPSTPTVKHLSESTALGYLPCI